MDDSISRQAAKLKVARVTWEPGDSFSDFHDKCVDCLDDVPSAQPERKTGKWIHNRDEDGWHIWLECSECGTREDNTNAKFCPECGSYNGG